MPIHSVVVNGELRFIQKDKLAKALQPLESQGFFSVDLDKIQVAVQQLPWVADVEVRRVWPDKIVIDITELIIMQENIQLKIESTDPENMDGSISIIPYLEIDG